MNAAKVEYDARLTHPSVQLDVNQRNISGQNVFSAGRVQQERRVFPVRFGAGGDHD